MESVELGVGAAEGVQGEAFGLSEPVGVGADVECSADAPYADDAFHCPEADGDGDPTP